MEFDFFCRLATASGYCDFGGWQCDDVQRYGRTQLQTDSELIAYRSQSPLNEEQIAVTKIGSGPPVSRRCA
jgi:hypothetical protein